MTALQAPARPTPDPAAIVEAAMTPRRQKNVRQPRSRERIQVTHPHAAGIDIHTGKHCCGSSGFSVVSWLLPGQ
jgi:hypothetical protein